MIIPENCKGCGKCCIWIQFKDIPEYKFCNECPDSKKLYYGKCQHLNDKNECDIYDSGRPMGCILIERGSSSCIEFLKSHENTN